MSAILTLNFAKNATISQAFDGNASVSSITVSDASNIIRTLQNGNGSNQINRYFVDDRSVAASTADTLNLQTLGGALEPLTGNTYTLTKIRFLQITNKSTTQALAISSANVSGLVVSPQIINPNSGAFILVAGTGASDGWTIASNSTITLTNSSGAACAYTIEIGGAQ